MKLLLSLAMISLLFAGCASLTQTQFNAVSQFALTSRNFSAYPGKIITTINEIHVWHRIYFANSLKNPESHIKALVNAHQFKLKTDSFPGEIDITFKIIDKYAQSLILLTADKHYTSIDSLSNNFGTDLDALITKYNAIGKTTKVPAGIGGAVSRLLSFGAQQLVKIKQANAIKEFVPLADTLIAVMTGNLLGFLQRNTWSPALQDSISIEKLVMQEELTLQQDYAAWLGENRAGIENEKEYFQCLENLAYAKHLQQQTIQATMDMRAAHKALLSVITKKETLKEKITELQKYYEGVKTIRSEIAKITFNK